MKGKNGRAFRDGEGCRKTEPGDGDERTLRREDCLCVGKSGRGGRESGSAALSNFAVCHATAAEIRSDSTAQNRCPVVLLTVILVGGSAED